MERERSKWRGRGPTAFLNSTSGARGRSALHLAAVYGHTECCERLLLAGADATLEDESGETALSEAVRWKREACIAVLRAQGGG